MDCNVTFFYATPNKYIHFSEKSCDQILAFMEKIKLPPKDEKNHYISTYNIDTFFPPNHTHRTFGSFARKETFECLLKCAIQSSSHLDQMQCSNSCENTAKKVHLNWIDKIAYPSF